MRVCPSADNGSRVRRDVSFLFMSVVPLDFSPFFFSLLTIPTYWSSLTSAWLPSSFLPPSRYILPSFQSFLHIFCLSFRLSFLCLLCFFFSAPRYASYCLEFLLVCVWLFLVAFYTGFVSFCTRREGPIKRDIYSRTTQADGNTSSLICQGRQADIEAGRQTDRQAAESEEGRPVLVS